MSSGASSGSLDLSCGSAWAGTVGLGVAPRGAARGRHDLEQSTRLQQAWPRQQPRALATRSAGSVGWATALSARSTASDAPASGAAAATAIERPWPTPMPTPAPNAANTSIKTTKPATSNLMTAVIVLFCCELSFIDPFPDPFPATMPCPQPGAAVTSAIHQLYQTHFERSPASQACARAQLGTRPFFRSSSLTPTCTSGWSPLPSIWCRWGVSQRAIVTWSEVPSGNSWTS